MTSSLENRFSLSDRELHVLRTVGARGWSGLASQGGKLRPSPGRGSKFLSLGSLCLCGESPVLIGAETSLTPIRTEVFRIASFDLPKDRQSLFRPPLQDIVQEPLTELARVLGERIEEIIVLSVAEFILGSEGWLIDQGILFRRGESRLLLVTSNDVPLDIDLTTDTETIRGYLRRVVGARCIFHR